MVQHEVRGIVDGWVVHRWCIPGVQSDWQYGIEWPDWWEWATKSDVPIPSRAICLTKTDADEWARVNWGGRG